MFRRFFKMKCKTIQKNLMDYLYGELSPSDVLSFENHLRECPACRTEVTTLKETMSAFETLASHEPSGVPSARILAAARNASQQWKEKPAGRSWIFNRWVPAVSLAMLVIAVGLAVHLSQSLKQGKEISAPALEVSGKEIAAQKPAPVEAKLEKKAKSGERNAPVVPQSVVAMPSPENEAAAKDLRRAQSEAPKRDAMLKKERDSETVPAPAKTNQEVPASSLSSPAPEPREESAAA